MVGILVSSWVPAYFQGRTVSFRDGTFLSLENLWKMFFFTAIFISPRSPHLTATAFVAAVGARKVTGEPAVGKAAKVMEVILVPFASNTTEGKHPGDYDWLWNPCWIVYMFLDFFVGGFCFEIQKNIRPGGIGIVWLVLYLPSWFFYLMNCLDFFFNFFCFEIHK